MSKMHLPHYSDRYRTRCHIFQSSTNTTTDLNLVTCKRCLLGIDWQVTQKGEICEDSSLDKNSPATSC